METIPISFNKIKIMIEPIQRLKGIKIIFVGQAQILFIHSTL